jgi:hypothetical protein
MYYRYYALNNLSKVIALSSGNANAHRAAVTIPDLKSHLCANPKIDEQVWGQLAKKAKSAEDLYALAYSSTSIEQANYILKDRRYAPKVGLLRGNNAAVNSDFLREIYEVSKKSVTVQEALLSRKDLPVDILEKIDLNTKMSYRVIWSLIHNENINWEWLANYFSTHPESHKAMMYRMPVLLDKHKDLVKFFLRKTLQECQLIKRHIRLELLSCLSETRHLNQSDAEEILNYVKTSKSKSNTKVKILLGLLGNPNISSELALGIKETFNSKSIESIVLYNQKQDFTNLVDIRKKMPQVVLKPGWDYELSAKEKIVFEALAPITQNHGARVGFITTDISETSKEKQELSAKEASDLPARPTGDMPYWSWRDLALGAIKYIDTEYADAPQEAWVSLLNLGQNWDGCVSELLQVSKNL